MGVEVREAAEKAAAETVGEAMVVAGMVAKRAEDRSQCSPGRMRMIHIRLPHRHHRSLRCC